MFDETRSCIERTSSCFLGDVHDAFGRSVQEKTFDELVRILNGMKQADDMSRRCESAIWELTKQLRLLL